MSLSPFIEDEADRAGEPLPALLLDGELLSSGARQRVELCVAPRLRLMPFGGQPAALLEAMQCVVERSLVDTNSLARDDREMLRDGVAMGRSGRQRLQDQHVECPLRNRETGACHELPQP